jgi:hypothetical protein
MPKSRRPSGAWAPSVPYTHKAFLPYATALGQLTLAWNDLHESLAMLFCGVMGGGFSNQYLAVWHGIPSDRAQRNVLVAAVEAGLVEGGPPQLLDDVKWIRARAEELEEIRNNALHSPLWGTPMGQATPIIQPVIGLGHIRANKLAGKNLLAEYRYCRDATTVVRDFAIEVDKVMSRGGKWPKQPKLPDRKPYPKKSLAKATKA